MSTASRERRDRTPNTSYERTAGRQVANRANNYVLMHISRPTCNRLAKGLISKSHVGCSFLWSEHLEGSLKTLAKETAPTRRRVGFEQMMFVWYELSVYSGEPLDKAFVVRIYVAVSMGNAISSIPQDLTGLLFVVRRNGCSSVIPRW